MPRIELILFFFAISGMVFANDEDENRHGGHGGGFGGHGGGHNGFGGGFRGRNCSVVTSGTTACTGAASLATCTNSTYLAAQAVAGNATVLVCRGVTTSPFNATITLSVQIFGGFGFNCFLVPTSETRTCTALALDTTFVKNSCNNQAALLANLKIGPTVRVCLRNRFGGFRSGNVTIIARV